MKDLMVPMGTEINNCWLHTRALKYHLSVLETYFECEGGKMYLLQLYLVTTETSIVQRSRSSPPSMGYTALENTLD